jgi:fructan beta-fructosidase
LIESSDQERHLLPLYDEKMRPQFHHSQKQGWNNDPNGMVYYDGEYHLFWQCNPVGTQWGNMYWGHSSSPDMIHWTEHRRALRPFGGTYTPNRHPSLAVKNCFSGSANVDVNNTGGWQTGKEKVTVAVFTDTGCGEALAYSNDRGMNWTYYDKNPVIKHNGRDPKLVWYEPGQHWVIAVFDQDPDRKIGGNIAFYSSKNLKDWTLTSKLPGYFECPEMFELPVDGDKKNTRWVVFAANAKYAVGNFDGETFTPEHEDKHTLHYGNFYASQCFSRPPDGRVRHAADGGAAPARPGPAGAAWRDRGPRRPPPPASRPARGSCSWRSRSRGTRPCPRCPSSGDSWGCWSTTRSAGTRRSRWSRTTIDRCSTRTRDR